MHVTNFPLLTSLLQNKIITDGVFKINESYSYAKKYVKVNTIQKKETPDEIQATTEKVLFERKFVIDAQMMKIIKARKSIHHEDLIRLVFEQFQLPILVSNRSP